MKNSFLFIPVALLFSGISSCQWAQNAWKNSSSNSSHQWVTHSNKVDDSAKKISARYGREYNLSGNVIAEYPDFNVKLDHTKIKGTETICVYEISSKDGDDKTTIDCSTAKPDKQHLYLAGMHFFYHSDTPGKLNIYFPPILMASTTL